MRQLSLSRALLIAVWLVCCSRRAVVPPLVSGSITSQPIQSQLPVNAFAWVDCVEGPRIIASTGELYDAGGAPLGTAWSDRTTSQSWELAAVDVDGDGLTDLVAGVAAGTEPTALSSSLVLRKASAPCIWLSPQTMTAPVMGIPRSIFVDDIDGDGRSDVVTAWRFGTAGPARILLAPDWRETEPATRPAPASGMGWPTWFVRRWQSRWWYGLDSGTGWTDPAVDGFSDGDPMGSSLIHVAGDELLFVSKEPGKNTLYRADGSTVSGAGVDQGTDGADLQAVTWEPATYDVDGDGLEDIVALAMEGHDASDGTPRQPLIFLQTAAGQFADVAPQLGEVPKEFASRLRCHPKLRPLTCIALSDDPVNVPAQIIVVDVKR